MAALCATDPLFAFFAALPGPDVDIEACIAEAERAFDELGAVGVGMFTSYGQAHTTFPGDASFESLWAFLNERAAVVHLHPTTPSSTMLAVGGDSRRALAPPAIDYTHETTRAACDLIYSGTKGAHPDVAIILSHAGGTLPFIAQRAAFSGPLARAYASPISAAQGPFAVEDPAEFMALARSFYFDTALSGDPPSCRPSRPSWEKRPTRNACSTQPTSRSCPIRRSSCRTRG